MRTNGLLYAETRADGGVNEYGEPLGDSVQWGQPIECCFVPNVDTRLGKYEDGEFRQASFTILIESQPFRAERIRLVCGDTAIGEFRIISVRPLSLGRIQITV